MSLGVLNNLNAMYAENNLNNTSNSLNTVLQQLSSGSKINSGADDAAGLSLVDGLQANSMALAQSQTNSAEGVGMLKVADGALSQVTNLLNRAVTLATEASNGTLNSSQDAAANSEYQSILSEINNIGTTTTYNNQTVFGGGSPVNIYTGDSSTAGSSIDALNIGALSSSNVGDSGGMMAYSSGQSGVFLNLSSATQNAQSTDTLNSNGTSTINVSYLVKGANGSSTPSTTSISVGGTNSQPNTAQGLINAINGAGLGLSATFSTAAQSGVAGGGTQTGIEITGGVISAGVDPNASSTSGTLNPSEITNSQLALGQVVTVNSGSTNVATFTISSTNDTLDQIAAQINAGTGGAGSTAGMVTANVIKNSANQETSLQLSDAANGGPLTVTVTPTSVAPAPLTAQTTVTAATAPVGVVFTQTATGGAGSYAQATLAIPGGVADNNPTLNNLTGSITLTNGTNTKTFHLNASSGTNSSTDVYLNNASSSLNGLAAAISDATYGLGATATASTAGISIVSNTTGTGTITAAASPTLAATLNATVNSNVTGLAATAGTDGSTVISMTGGVGMGILPGAGTALATGTHITLKNGGGAAYTFIMGTNAGDVLGSNGNTAAGITTTALTAGSLAQAINDNSTTTGMTANIANGVLTVSSTAVNTSIVASVNNLAGIQALSATPVNGGNPTANNNSTGNFTIGTGNPADGSLTTTGDTLTGSMTITNNGITDTFVMGTGSGPAGTYYTGAATLASLQSTIQAQASTLDVNATFDTSAGTAATGLTLTSTNYTTTIATAGPGIVDTSTVGHDAQGSIGSGANQYLTATLSADDGGVLDTTGASKLFAGTFAINETGTGVNSGTPATLNVVVGTAGVNDATHVYVAGTGGVASINQIVTAINTFIGSATNTTGGKVFDVTASLDTTTGGLTVQAGANNGTDSALSITTANLTAAQTFGVGATYSAGSAKGDAIVNVGNGAGTIDANSFNDLLTDGGTLRIKNTAGVESTDGLQQVTFTLGHGGTETGDGTNAVTTAADSMSSLMTAINNQTGMDLSATIVNGALQIKSTDTNDTGALTVSIPTTLSQAYGVGNVAGTLSGVTVNAGTGPAAATNASVSINTGAGMATAGTDTLGGTLLVQNGNGTAYTYNMGSGSSGANPVTVTNATEQGLVNAINGNTATTGIAASINSTTGALQLQSNSTNTAITATSALTDSTNASGLVTVQTGGATSDSKTVISLGLNSDGLTYSSLAQHSGGDLLTGGVTITGANGNSVDFVTGTGASDSVAVNSGTSKTVTLSAADSTVAGLMGEINNTYNAFLAMNASYVTGGNLVAGGDIQLQSTLANSTAITAVTDSGNNLKDTMGNAAAKSTVGLFASGSDVVSGSFDISVGGSDRPIAALNTIAAGTTVNQLVNYINTGNYAGTGPTGVNGITASLVSAGANGYQTIQLVSNVYGTAGNITNGTGNGVSLTDHSTAATLTYAQNSAYNVGISNLAGASGGVYDASTQAPPTNSPSTGVIAAYANLSTQSSSGSGVATMSYSHGAGQSLSATDLISQTDARSTLTALNQAITDLAAQDGYIGAQINTLNSVSSVLSTQQQNVVSAQNAVQATDYASAASNMSKYEILSQTGISALAQANSMQQEVTKLLQ